MGMKDAKTGEGEQKNARNYLFFMRIYGLTRAFILLYNNVYRGAGAQVANAVCCGALAA